MYEFDVEGMSCSHCVAAITRSVQAVDPGAKVTVDLASKQVSVETTRPATDVEAAIVDAGYEITGRRA